MSFHEDLAVGTNTIILTMTADGSNGASYSLNAIAIGVDG